MPRYSYGICHIRSRVGEIEAPTEAEARRIIGAAIDAGLDHPDGATKRYTGEPSTHIAIDLEAEEGSEDHAKS